MGWLQMEESSCLPFLWPLPHCCMPNGSAEWLRSLETVISLRHKCGQGWPTSSPDTLSSLLPPSSQSRGRPGRGRLLALNFCGCQRVSSELRKPQVRPNLQMQNYGNKDAGYLMRQNLGGIGFWLTCKEKAGWGKVEKR